MAWQIETRDASSSSPLSHCSDPWLEGGATMSCWQLISVDSWDVESLTDQCIPVEEAGLTRSPVPDIVSDRCSIWVPKAWRPMHDSFPVCHAQVQPTLRHVPLQHYCYERIPDLRQWLYQVHLTVYEA